MVKMGFVTIERGWDKVIGGMEKGDWACLFSQTCSSRTKGYAVILKDVEMANPPDGRL